MRLGHLLFAKRGFDRDEAWRLCEAGATICGLLAEEPDATNTTFNSGFDSGKQTGGSITVRSSDENKKLSLWSSEARSDAANARRLIKRFGDVLRWCEAWQSWLVYDGMRWRVDDLLGAESRCKEVMGDLWTEAVEVLRNSEERALASAVTSFAKASNSANGVRNTLTLAKSEPGIAITPSQFDADGWLFNCPNGTLDLLGHASIKITLDTYSHVLPTMQKSPAETMQRLFG